MLEDTESLNVFLYNINTAILGVCLLSNQLRAYFSVISVFSSPKGEWNLEKESGFCQLIGVVHSQL